MKKISDFSKPKVYANKNAMWPIESNFDLEENTVVKKEKMLVTSIFFFFPQCFQNRLQQGHLTLFQTSPGFYVSAVQVF